MITTAVKSTLGIYMYKKLVGKKYIPLTGFSIAGSLYEDLKSVGFSEEEAVQSRYKGPKYMIFKGIKIS